MKFTLSHYNNNFKSITLNSSMDMILLLIMIGGKISLFLRRIFWLIKLTLIVTLLLPGSIPTIFLFLTKYTLNIVDPEDLIISFVSGFISGIFDLLPPLVQTLIIPILVLLVVITYLIALKILHPKESLITIMRKKRDSAYEKFVKIPS